MTRSKAGKVFRTITESDELQDWCGDFPDWVFRCFMGGVSADVDLGTLAGWLVLRETGQNRDTFESSFEMTLHLSTDQLATVENALDHGLDWLRVIEKVLSTAQWESDTKYLYDYNPDGSVRLVTILSRFAF